jgi:hypothetical protein
MTMATMQTDMKTTAQNLKESSPEPEPPEIGSARAKVRNQEGKVWWAKTWYRACLGRCYWSRHSSSYVKERLGE